MSKISKDQLQRLKRALNGTSTQDSEKYQKFASVVGRGGSFGNQEVKRAIDAGYTMDDVNGYLKYSGITPQGDFAVGGYKENTFSPWGTKDSGDVNSTTTKDPFYRFVGATPPATQQKATDPAPAAPDPAPAPQTSPGNPELTIPGVDVRLVGENLGIKPKNSAARKSGQINKGTNRLTIPRSSGFTGINLG